MKIIISSPPPYFSEAMDAVGLTSANLCETRRNKKSGLQSKIEAKKTALQDKMKKGSKRGKPMETDS